MIGSRRKRSTATRHQTNTKRHPEITIHLRDTNRRLTQICADFRERLTEQPRNSEQSDHVVSVFIRVNLRFKKCASRSAAPVGQFRREFGEGAHGGVQSGEVAIEEIADEAVGECAALGRVGFDHFAE